MSATDGMSLELARWECTSQHTTVFNFTELSKEAKKLLKGKKVKSFYPQDGEMYIKFNKGYELCFSCNEGGTMFVSVFRNNQLVLNY